jgi:hypothetical protein
MRYVAVSRADISAPLQILGVGETMDEAYAGARAWFDNAFLGVDSGDPRWRDLLAMQNNLDAVSEDVLSENSGLGLDDWLARLAAIGQSPGTPQPPKPWRGLEPYRDLKDGWDRTTWILAALYLIGLPIFRMSLFWRDQTDSGLGLSTSFLFPYFFLVILIQVVYAVFWFKVFQFFFGDDQTLQDFLFFLLLVGFGRIVAMNLVFHFKMMGIPI